MRKAIITANEEFQRLKLEWKTLLTQIPNHTIFMTWEWQYIWWETYANRFPGSQLRIMAYYQDNQLVALLPYFIYQENVGPFKIKKAAYLASKIESSDYLDVITLPDYRSYFMEHLALDLKELAEDADVIELNHCLPESIMYQAMGANTNGNAFAEQYRVCPYVELPDSFDEYLKRLSSNFRYNVRRRIKKLINKEGARFELLTDDTKIESTVEDIFELHYQRAQQKGLSTKFVRELRQEFHKKVAQALMPEGYIHFFHLFSSSGEKIAALYCFKYDNTLAYFQAGFNPAWSSFSPGMVILGKAIEYAIQHRMRVFDFMRGGEAYKKNWGTVDRHIYLITVSNSITGKGFLSYYKLRKWISKNKIKERI